MTIKTSPVENECRLRIRLAVAAFAYEVMNSSVMPDHEFDRLCLMINPTLETGNPKMDTFFKDKFDPSTGSWVHLHPEIDKLRILYDNLYKG